MRLAVSKDDDDAVLRAAARAWVDEHVPTAWQDAASEGRAAIRAVRPRAEYEAWYPTFAESGMAVATWPVAYGGLDLGVAQAKVIEDVIGHLNLGRLNPLGLNNAAPPLFAHGTEEQRLRFLPAIVRNDERWCQLFSEPGAGSDLASLAMMAERDGDEWILTGQKVWSTWAHQSDFAICLARTDPEAPKRKGISYFLVDLHSPGVEVRELQHMGGEVDFNEVWFDEVRVPAFNLVGAVNDGWRVAGATLAGERQMVSGAGSGGVDRIGGSGADRLVASFSAGGTSDPVLRDHVVGLLSEERIRKWTNERVRATVKAGGTPGPAASIGKVHQGTLNQQIQLAACDLLGSAAIAWPGEWLEMPYETKGMIRSRANTIEGGTTEVNKNVLGEKVLGLPREPDPHHGAPWKNIPR